MDGDDFLGLGRLLLFHKSYGTSLFSKDDAKSRDIKDFIIFFMVNRMWH